MGLYRVTLSQTVYEIANVDVEADSPEQAGELAIAGAEQGTIEVYWRFQCQTDEPIDAIEASEIAPLTKAS